MRTRLSSLALVTVILASVPACSAARANGGDEDARVGGGNAPSAEGGAVAEFLQRSISSEAGARSYRLYVPGAYDGEGDLPLIVMLHGCTQNAADFATGTRMNLLAEEGPFLVAYPEQAETDHPQRCWNWYDPAHQARGRGEPAIIAAITREVMSAYRINRRRVYVAGLSAGGIMAVTMAATYPDLYAAVASHSGVPFAAAGSVGEAVTLMREGSLLRSHEAARRVLETMGERRRVIPMIAIHGAADPVVNAMNTQQLTEQWILACADIEGSLVRSLSSMDEGGTESDYTYRVSRAYTGGAGAVEVWMVEDLGHAWSGGSPEGTYTDPRGVDASREIVRFFNMHALP